MVGHDYKDIFVEEAREQVDVLNDRLLVLEKEPNNIPFMNDIFRVAHTLKSSAAFVGLQELSDFCHKVESLLQKIKDKEIELTTKIVDFLFKSLDKIRDSVELFAEKDEVASDFEEIAQEIDQLNIESQQTVQETNESTDTEKKEEQMSFSFDNKTWSLVEESQLKGETFYHIKVTFEPEIKMKWVRAELVYVNIERMGTLITSLPKPDQFKTDKLGDALHVIFATSTADIPSIKKQLELDLIRQIDVIELSDEQLLAYKVTKESDETPSESSEESINKAESKVEKDIKDNSEQKENMKWGRRKSDVVGSPEEFETKGIISKSDTVRVSIKKLDDLLNQVGELAITNSGFVEVSERFYELLGNVDIVTEFKGKIDELSNIARNLQEGIMQSRMVSIGTVFSRFTRLVRDLSKNLDKKIDIQFRGEETELDKKIVDVIGEPLIHLIRNSIDHGIESVEERKKLGKSETGKIILNAYQSGNHIFIEVIDDGHGLNKEKILNKAIEKGLITHEEANRFSGDEISNLIFLPGFSTKKEVTAISGRGVGMDVVLQTVNQLNGSVIVTSNEGEGSVFTLSFPLTLAIVPAILIVCGDENYAIPLSSVIETIKINPSDIQTVDFQEVIRLREQVIPLLWLNDLFKIDSQRNGKLIPIVISDYRDQQIGIVVDHLIGKREIVIKSLSQNYKETKGIAGATILGNGQIALIIDVPGLIDQNKQLGRSTKRHSQKRDSTISKAKKQSKLMDLKLAEEEEQVKQNILKVFELDDLSYQLVKELFKSAIATSSNNIKRFLNKEVALAIPHIEVHLLEKVKNVPKFLGEEKMFFAEVDITKALSGKVIIALDEAGMIMLFKELVGDQPMQSPVGESCIMEIGNLLSAGITNTLSRALEIQTYPGPPVFFYESFKDYFKRLFQEHHNANNNYIWTIDTDIIVDSTLVKGKVYIFPYDSSFKKIGKAVHAKKDALSFMLPS